MTIDSQGSWSGTGTDRGAITYLRPPSPEAVFTRRAERFATLSTGHTLAEYLELLARVAQAQRVAWEKTLRRSRAAQASELTLRAGRAVEHAVEAPLDVTTHRRDPAWRAALRVIVDALAAGTLPSETRTALDRLARASAADVEAIADRLLANAPEPSDLSSGPFVGAALQVYFTSLAEATDASSVQRTGAGCPVCGSPPVAGVILGDDRLRYLVCSVCASQWHHTRIVCAACRSGEHVTYYRLEGDHATTAPSASAVKAEACSSCKAYTKLFYEDADPRLEPFADDVATLALDLLMAEDGWSRHGVNPLLLATDLGGPEA